MGEIITLTVFGDDGIYESGDPVVAYGVYGRLVYNGALVGNGSRSRTKLVGGLGPWFVGAPTALDTNANSPTSAYSEAFNQIASISTAQDAANFPGTLSTVTLIASAAGIVSVNWFTELGTGFELYFFGLTNAPGTTFMIVPEPSVAALLGLGLLGLARLRKARAYREPGLISDLRLR